MSETLLSNVRFYFAQSVFMTTCHYNAYGRYVKKRKRSTNTVIALSIVTILLLILQVIGLQTTCLPLLGTVSLIGLVLSGTSLVFEIANKEDSASLMFQQKIYAEKYKSLRDEYMSLIEEIMSGNVLESELRVKRDAMQKRYSSLGENAPPTNGDDYKKAQLGLGLKGSDSEEFTWSDKEIDKFLPAAMRLNKK